MLGAGPSSRAWYQEQTRANAIGQAASQYWDGAVNALCALNLPRAFDDIRQMSALQTEAEHASRSAANYMDMETEMNNGLLGKPSFGYVLNHWSHFSRQGEHPLSSTRPGQGPDQSYSDFRDGRWHTGMLFSTTPKQKPPPPPPDCPVSTTTTGSDKLHSAISNHADTLQPYTTSELNSFLDGGCDVKTLWQRLQTNALKSTDKTYIATGGALRALVTAITVGTKQSLSDDKTNRLAALLSYLYREAYKIGPSTDSSQKHSALSPLTQENAGTILNHGHYSAAVLKRLFGDESISYTTKKTSKGSFFRMLKFLRTKQNTSHDEVSLRNDFTAAIRPDNYNTNGSLDVFGPLFKKVRDGVQSQQSGPDFLTTLLSIKYEKDSNPSKTYTLRTNADKNQLQIEPKSTNSYKLTYDHKMYQLLFCGILFKRLTAYYPIPIQSPNIDFSQETDFLRLLGEENSLQSKPIGSINFTIASDSSSTQRTQSKKPRETPMIETLTESLKTRKEARNKLKTTQKAIEAAIKAVNDQPTLTGKLQSIYGAINHLNSFIQQGHLFNDQEKTGLATATKQCIKDLKRCIDNLKPGSIEDGLRNNLSTDCSSTSMYKFTDTYEDTDGTKKTVNRSMKRGQYLDFYLAILDGKKLDEAKNIKDGSQSLDEDSFTSLFESVSSVLAKNPASPTPTTGTGKDKGFLWSLGWLRGG